MTGRMVEDGEPSMSRGKGKQKRPPQRGLGVAQLEKIRLEEQHKNSNAAASSSSSPPPPPPPPCTQPLLPLPLNPIVDLSSPPSFPNHPAGISGPRGFLAQWIDHRPVGNPLGLISSCPSLPRVNSTMISPTSASGLCFHMEPPSSQIFYYNHTLQSSSSSSWPPPSSSSSWQEDDRNLVYTTGKRPCHENMQNLSPYKIPSVSGSFVRAAHSPLLYRNMVSRDCMPSCSSYQVDTEQKHAELHAHQSKKENCFLTLGNRAPSPMRSDIWSQNQERVDDDHDTSSYFGSSGPNACTPYYTFLPLATDVQKEKDIGDCEEAMSLDLNLKL